MAAKYIIWDLHGMADKIIVFDESISHLSMADSFGRKELIVSAGFVRFRPSKNGGVVARCSGESETLGIGSREEDSELVTRNFELDPYQE
jgi:hypothetical protein